MKSKIEKDKVNQDYSRREFIKVSTLTAGVSGVLSVYGLSSVLAAGDSNGLHFLWLDTTSIVQKHSSMGG